MRACSRDEPSYIRARVYTRTCVCGRISPPYESLIFISKNFFNKKVARSCGPPPAPALCIATGSRVQAGVYILYKGEARANYTGPRRIKSFARRSRYFITFLCFEKRAAGPADSSRRIRTNPRVHAIPLHVHARIARSAPARVRSSALHLHILVRVHLPRTERGEFAERDVSSGEKKNRAVPPKCNRTAACRRSGKFQHFGTRFRYRTLNLMTFLVEKYCFLGFWKFQYHVIFSDILIIKLRIKTVKLKVYI